MICIENYSKTLKKQKVLDDITLTLESGQCYGFVGYNGCGKTMLLRAICGYIKPDQGDVKVDGISMKDSYIKDAGIIIGEPQFMGGYSGLENLEILAAIQKKVSTPEIEHWLEQVDLLKEKNKKYSQYSLGMKQKLRIVQAFMEDPKYFILDEPFIALDKKSIERVEELIKYEKKKGKTILLTSHDERNIFKLCDKVYEMEEGRIRYEEKDVHDDCFNQ